MKGLSKGAVQVFIALVLVLGGFAPMASVAKADPGSISGVVNATGGEPILGATVQLYVYSSLLPGALPSRVQAGSTTTNATGHYTITPTMAGPYGVLARYSGKATEWYKLPDNTYNMYEAQSVADGATGINFSLENGVSISGRVTDNVTGSGVNGASISVALHSSLAPGMQRMYYDGATTNATGHYTITTLPPGYTFGVQARASGKATEWWQDTYNVYEADSVAGGATNINFSLETGGTISGYVYEQDGSTPIVGATVSTAEWSSLTSGQRISYDGATTTTDGAYTISSLPPGADHLFGVQARASGRASEWYKTPTTGTYFASEAVSVATPASGVNISLDPGGSILGRVTATAGGLGIPNASISVVLHSSLTTSPRKYFDGGRTLSDGTYTVSGLPAGYVVGVQARASDYASEWWNGKYTLPADQVTVLAAGTPDINFSLEAGGSISGVVTKTLGGGGISGASINVFVHSSVISGGSWVSYDGATTGTSGSYTVSGLPAGDVPFGPPPPATLPSSMKIPISTRWPSRSR